MKEIVNQIKKTEKREVLVIGDVMLDEYIFGEVSRISPEAPVPVLKEERREWSLGGAANVALNCKHIGCKVNLVGVIGNNDRAGEKFASMLWENGVSANGLIKSKTRVTTCKKRVLDSSQQLLRIDAENNNLLSENEFAQVSKKIEEFIKQETIILISDYAKGVLTPQLLSRIFLLARERDCIVLLDPKGDEFEKYKGVNYLKPNYKEYLQIVDFYGLSKKDSIVENGKKICELLLLDGLVVTLGEKGIQFISKDADIFIPACKKEVFDLTGAGDTVLAFMALGLAVNLPIKQCLKMANHAAAVAISHIKTYAVSLEELIDKNVDVTEKIFADWATLKIELDWLRLEQKKVVFTNGSFDLLHSGHIHVLQEAKKMGDILVVAVNTDASVKRYKGEKRPIKILSERMKVLSAIGVIDFVVSFDQDTPKQIIEYLKPDVLVKGGDYKKEIIVGAQFVEANGGQVKVVDYQEGFSTTNLVEIAKKSGQAVF